MVFACMRFLGFHPLFSGSDVQTMCRHPAWIRARGPSVIDSGVRPAATFLITSAAASEANLTRVLLFRRADWRCRRRCASLGNKRIYDFYELHWIKLPSVGSGWSVGWLVRLVGRSASMYVSEWRSLNEQIHPAAAAPVPRVIWPTLGWICHSFPLLLQPPSVGRPTCNRSYVRQICPPRLLFFHICCSRSEAKWVGTSIGALNYLWKFWALVQLIPSRL